MSPVVTINCIIALAEQGYGEDKDVATLMFTAASLDDIHIVLIYSISYAFILNGIKFLNFFVNFFDLLFSIKNFITNAENKTIDDSPHFWFRGGFNEIFIGIILGVTLGLFFSFFPHRNHVSNSYRN